MSDRGEYRAIRRVLIDGPDFQQLPERGRSLFLFLKINFGPSGIEVWYPDELIARLTRQTGMPANAVRDVLDVLEKAGWVARQDNIVWIVGQLDNDPHIRSNDKKHRASVMSHLGGLPRLDIVRRFVELHVDWFPEDEAYEKGLGWCFDESSEGHTRVLEGSGEGHRSTDNKTDDKPEDNNQPEGAGAPAVQMTEAQAKKAATTEAVECVARHYTAIHTRRKITPELRKLIARRLEHHTAEEMCLAIDGNAHDPWHVERGKHELSYVLRNTEQIETFMERARIQATAATASASGAAGDGGGKSYAESFYRFVVANGMSQPLPLEELDAKIDDMAETGLLRNPTRVKAELRAVAPWGWMRHVRPGFERQAIDRIAEALALHHRQQPASGTKGPESPPATVIGSTVGAVQ